ncbi:hypothetical protein [Streptomyces sp. NBRC 110028]|uniref:hypothetical protein n=1 Tax=Streptomyces sp. NBRC 110028 TaxID=1621260 RepID=UPI0006E192E0|nr:hypothetical protein [Streptomyces sp. NBRC 110028]
MSGTPAPRTDRSPRTDAPRASRGPRVSARSAVVVTLVAGALALGGCMSISDDSGKPDRHRGGSGKGGGVSEPGGGVVVRTDGRGHTYTVAPRDAKGHKRKGGERRSPSASAVAEPGAEPTPSAGKGGSRAHGPAPSLPPEPGQPAPSEAAPEPRPSSPPPSAPDPKPTPSEPASAPASEPEESEE